MKTIKRLFLILFVFFILLIAVAIAIPIIYKDEMVDIVKEQINATINAKADFAEVDISLISSFPHLNVALSDFSVVGIDQFEAIPLVAATKAGVTVDIWSLMASEGPLEIRSVELFEPSINILVLADGSANYDIAKPVGEEAVVETEEAATEMAIALRSYSIEKGTIRYDDKSSDIFLEIVGLNHSGKGDFTLTEYDLDTETSIEKMTVRQEGINYLKNAELDLDAIFHIDTENSIYILKDNKLRVNALELLADGQVQMKGDDIILDFNFNAPSNDFRALWSLIPSAYTADFDQVKIAGVFQLEGLVKGVYNENTYPAFRVQTRVENGQVKYPDLPLAVADIEAFLDINSPSSNLNDMKINLSSLQLKVGDDPFKAWVKVVTPISDPNVDANMDGIIDLAKWAKAFPIDGVEEMAGRIVADVSINTKMSTIEREAYEDVDMSGDISLTGLRYADAGLPLIQINKAIAKFTPKQVNIAEFNAQFGQSDIRASGHIDNILAYISPETTMKGVFKAHSNYFLVDEWMEESGEVTTTVATDAPAIEEAVFDRFDIALDATADKIVYEGYTLTNTVLKGRVRPNLVEIDRIQMNLGESDFSGNGTITNGFDYAFSDGILGGVLQLNSTYFDLNPFMEEEASTARTTGASEDSYGVIPIPPNIDMVINGQFNKIHYTDMDMFDVVAKMTIRDESVVIEQGSAKTLGGAMGFTGLYDTKNVDKPSYNFKFDLDKMDFQKSFTAFNTFQSFAPIGKFVNGDFSTSLIMSGELGDDMMPLLASVSAEGLFETLDGSITGMKPLQAIGNALDVDDLKNNVSFENLKTWFTIANGFFEVKPFDVTLANLPMTIAGKHSLTQEMDYTLNTVIPRSMLGSGSLGNVVNQGVSALVQQAGKLGLNVNDAENLNVQITMKGSMDDPKIGFKLLGTDGDVSLVESVKEEAQAVVQQQIDEVKEQVTEQVNDAKDRAEAEARRRVDSLKVIADAEIKKQRETAEEELRKRAQGRLDSLAALENLRNQAGGVVDSLKGKLNDFNPFGRRRRNGGGGE